MNEIKFRSSSSGYLMTEARSKTELISETTKTHLIDVFVSAKYGRREEITSKFLDKGNACEEDSITALSRVKKIVFKKNEVRLENDFIAGTPDIYLGNSINDATETFDTKTSWSANTYFRSQKKLDDMYYWQGQCYMMLTGAKKHTVAYCLVNGTAQAILDEKRKISFKSGMTDQHGNESEIFKAKCRQIEINHIYDLGMFNLHNPHFDFHNDLTTWNFDIPLSERVFCFEFERNDNDIERLKNRIIECREWLRINCFKTN